MADIAAIILTYNEAKHIERCIASIKGVCREIFVIDSGSSDGTQELAMKAGATQVLEHKWKNYATQFNWGLENAPITAEWVWRIDADEFVTSSLAKAVEEVVSGSRFQVSGSVSQVSGSRFQVSGSRSQVSGSGSQVSGSVSQVSGSRFQVSGSRSPVSGSGSQVSGSRIQVSGSGSQDLGSSSQDLGSGSQVSGSGDVINGFYVRKRIDFLGRPLLHGGWYPQYHLKIFRRGHGACENRWMDEHITLTDGTTMTIDTGDQVDANLNDLSWWTEKHNGYATREMVDMLMLEYGMDDEANEISPKLFGTEPERKRWLKIKYVKSPLFVRPFLNFCLRYILRAGFLDGKQGLMWHFLQGFWYRFLVDAKIWETKRRFGNDPERIKAWIRENYGI